MKNWKVELIAEGKNFNRSENIEEYLPERSAFTTTMYNCNDIAQSHT